MLGSRCKYAELILTLVKYSSTCVSFLSTVPERGKENERVKKNAAEESLVQLVNEWFPPGYTFFSLFPYPGRERQR